MHCSSLSSASWHASAKTFASFRLNFPGRLDENLRNGNFISVTRVPAIVSHEPRNLQRENSFAQTKVIRYECPYPQAGVVVVSPGTVLVLNHDPRFFSTKCNCGVARMAHTHFGSDTEVIGNQPD